MYRFENKVIVITGATSGIGEETAKRFALEGGTVILVGRNRNKGENIVKKLNTNGFNDIYFMQCDISNVLQVKELAEAIENKYGKVDVLFNNAGIMLQSIEIENMQIEDWKNTFDINVNGLFFMTRSMKKLIMKCQGTIINNASIAGMHNYVTGRSYAYSASKAAVIQFSRQMAKNYAENGIRVNCICPGIIETPILGDRDRYVYSERIPLKRIGSTQEVANVVLFLASEEASYITGIVLPVDGGVQLGI